MSVHPPNPKNTSDVFEIEIEAARLAEHLAGVASTAPLRELEGLIDEYESLQTELTVANDIWHARLHERGQSSSG